MSLLSMASLACLSLIHPLRWPYVFIPILPPALLDFLDCPTPYIVGIHSSLIPNITEVIFNDIHVSGNSGNYFSTEFFHDVQRSDLPEHVTFFIDECRWATSRPILALPFIPEQSLRLALLNILQPQLSHFDECLASESAIRDSSVYSVETTQRIQVRWRKHFNTLNLSCLVFLMQRFESMMS